MKLIINNTSSDDYSYLSGSIVVSANGSTDVSNSLWLKLYSDLQFLSDLRSNNIGISDGVTTYSYPNSEIYVKQAIGQLTFNPPFADKVLSNGKKLYNRTTGKTFELVVGENTLDFTVPFNEVKFNGLEINDGKKGEKVTLQILDTASGAVSTIPNYMLNQFGDKVNVPNGFYRRVSDYDADLFLGLQIRVIYEAIEARTIGINYMIHELKV